MNLVGAPLIASIEPAMNTIAKESFLWSASMPFSDLRRPWYQFPKLVPLIVAGQIEVVFLQY